MNVRGCLETTAVLALALVVGGFLTSTWLAHSGGGEPAAGVPEDGPPGFSAEERGRIRVEVRNGSGIAGAAGRTTEFLRDAGFDVVDFGNADRFDHERTVVVDRVGHPRRAREVAAALRGVPIRTDPDSSLFLDVTVVIGEDLEEVLSRRDPEPGAGSRGWRGWLERIPWPGGD